MTDGMAAAIERLNKKRSPWPDDVFQELIRMDRRKTMVYQARNKVAHAFVDCFIEARPFSLLKRSL